MDKQDSKELEDKINGFWKFIRLLIIDDKREIERLNRELKKHKKMINALNRYIFKY